ncbi:hypothetical protein PISMIDRAFT_643355 [Pisolithus microcarpus 441]|uniref:Protein kinase domain-containing protein n=1 Tax=Pisolithus microcarpus 441 TaxID=765257 RepID=A0A0C9XNQ9_9AGAM|nr:hypothetical protein BKA83DRAFT_643355 [Pisolithus microcarpus]KIK14020.1 hypothetical protein PISMIDRAFT_643355 [Pisolithus microcarpus 441]
MLCSWWLICNAALQFMHSVDWVHCVISSGNALHLNKMGKLADPKYAKHSESNTTDEVQMDMLEFMACEVEAQEYLFQREMDKLFTLVKCLFKFNPLHDMESLWWIATWTLYYHVDQEGGWRSSEQIMQFHKLFPGRLEEHTNVFLTPLKYKVLR